MVSFWKGSLIGDLSKHRDYQHRSFIDHELDNGGSVEVPDEPLVWVNRNPIDYSLFDPSRKYYFVDFTLHEDTEPYEYLIPAEPDGSPPNEKRVKETLELYMRNRVPGGRDWFDYIDLDAKQNNPRVLARILADVEDSIQETPKPPKRFSVEDELI